MFDPDFTYPTDGLLIARPINDTDDVGLINDAVHAVATAHAEGDDSVTLGRVYRTRTNGTDHFRLADVSDYTYRYFRGVALNTATPEGMPVMVLGPDDADLPWVVGKVVHRDHTRRVYVTPLWGPDGAALPAIATGDAWARVAAIPPAALLWHPSDDLAAAEAKREARSTWLRWHVAWIALLGETTLRDWGPTLREIAESVDYTPPTIPWQVSALVSFLVSLPHRVTDEERAHLRSVLGLGTDTPLSTQGVYTRLAERLSTGVDSQFPPSLANDEDILHRLRRALAEKHSDALYLDNAGLTTSPAYL